MLGVTEINDGQGEKTGPVHWEFYLEEPVSVCDADLGSVGSFQVVLNVNASSRHGLSRGCQKIALNSNC